MRPGASWAFSLRAGTGTRTNASALRPPSARAGPARSGRRRPRRRPPCSCRGPCARTSGWRGGGRQRARGRAISPGLGSVRRLRVDEAVGGRGLGRPRSASRMLRATSSRLTRRQGAVHGEVVEGERNTRPAGARRGRRALEVPAKARTSASSARRAAAVLTERHVPVNEGRLDRRELGPPHVLPAEKAVDGSRLGRGEEHAFVHPAVSVHGPRADRRPAGCAQGDELVRVHGQIVRCQRTCVFHVVARRRGTRPAPRLQELAVGPSIWILAPPAPEELTNTTAKRGSSAMATKRRLP